MMRKPKNNTSVENEIFYNEDGSWENKSFREGLKKFQEKIERGLFYKMFNNGFKISEKRKELSSDNLKWAWIKIANTRKMCWVDNVTGKAYKAAGYEKTNIEIKDFIFERWCTGFDL